MPLSHRARIDAEIKTFQHQADIHDLPAIFHYWSHTHLGPYLAQAFSSNRTTEIFATELGASLARTGNPEIVSIGAGDGAIEIAIAQALRDKGIDRFHFHCLELSPHLIARGRDSVTAAGLGGHISFVQTDIGDWAPQTKYGALFAHHSLHHIVALEHLFAACKSCLAPGGAFVVADMIGRNGHMRWPETLAVMDAIWRTLPTAIKYNHLFGFSVDPYMNWDCSKVGFEGVRAQDILPLLLRHFQVETFAAWGGLTDMFVDRGYGHNLSPDDPEHRQFIDDLWAADRALARLGAARPTQMIAVFRNETCTLKSADGLMPARCAEPPPSAPRLRRQRIMRRLRMELLPRLGFLAFPLAVAAAVKRKAFRALGLAHSASSTKAEPAKKVENEQNH